MRQAQWTILLGLFLVLTLPTLATSAELCPAALQASPAVDSLAAVFQPAPSVPSTATKSESLAVAEPLPMAVACTKEACLAWRDLCRQACAPCLFTAVCAGYSNCHGPCTCHC